MALRDSASERASSILGLGVGARLLVGRPLLVELGLARLELRLAGRKRLVAGVDLGLRLGIQVVVVCRLGVETGPVVGDSLQASVDLGLGVRHLLLGVGKRPVRLRLGIVHGS